MISLLKSTGSIYFTDLNLFDFNLSQWFDFVIMAKPVF